MCSIAGQKFGKIASLTEIVGEKIKLLIPYELFVMSENNFLILRFLFPLKYYFFLQLLI